MVVLVPLKKQKQTHITNTSRVHVQRNTTPNHFFRSEKKKKKQNKNKIISNSPCSPPIGATQYSWKNKMYQIPSKFTNNNYDLYF